MKVISYLTLGILLIVAVTISVAQPHYKNNSQIDKLAAQYAEYNLRYNHAVERYCRTSLTYGRYCIIKKRCFIKKGKRYCKQFRECKNRPYYSTYCHYRPALW